MSNDTLNYIRFWGVRGSYPAPFGSHMRVGGNTSCVEFRADNHILICDGGSGIIPLGHHLLQEPKIKSLTILLTHYHWDHISGLPFFVPAFVPGWTINMYGPGDSKQEIEARISGQMLDPYFPIEAETWMAKIHFLSPPHKYLEYGPFKITPFFVHHPGSTFGYRIQIQDKTIIYASDNELSFVDNFMDARKKDLNLEEKNIFIALQQEEKERYLKLMGNANLFIHDAQYTPEDYAVKRGWGHSCYLDTVKFAMEAHIKQLYLFHVDPNYNDTKIEELHQNTLKYIHDCQSDIRCHVAREGLSIGIDTL
ncbi:MAG: MBL fold metallo-hydrolase [Thiomargarita sp.]|nr:MBL fold metallo-hydrolase [Thiomargarita sp.]